MLGFKTKVWSVTTHTHTHTTILNMSNNCIVNDGSKSFLRQLRIVVFRVRFVSFVFQTRFDNASCPFFWKYTIEKYLVKN